MEVSLSGAPGQPPVPWILSNPIYIGPIDIVQPLSDHRSPPVAFAIHYDNGPATGWAIEHREASAGALDVVPAVGGTQLSFRYALGGTISASPFAALVMLAGSVLPEYDRLIFTARADRPMRLSVQLRASGGEVEERWHRSAFLDASPREISVYFDDLMPRGFTRTPRPVLSNVDSLLFVVDTMNTRLGANGRIWIDDVKYAR